MPPDDERLRLDLAVDSETHLVLARQCRRTVDAATPQDHAGERCRSRVVQPPCHAVHTWRNRCCRWTTATAATAATFLFGVRSGTAASTAATAFTWGRWPRGSEYDRALGIEHFQRDLLRRLAQDVADRRAA